MPSQLLELVQKNAGMSISLGLVYDEEPQDSFLASETVHGSAFILRLFATLQQLFSSGYTGLTPSDRRPCSYGRLVVDNFFSVQKAF